MGRLGPDSTLTIRIDAHVLMWARMRALRDRTSVNARLRRYLEEYAAVPPGFWEGLPPPWPAHDSCPQPEPEEG